MRLYTHTHTHTHTNSLRNGKGITLVALVVTIVVLLILAGVSINLVLGENGLIEKAKEAKEKTNNSGKDEAIELALVNYRIEKEKNSNANLKECLQNELENIDILEENPSEDIEIIAKYSEGLLIIKSDGTYIKTKSENLVGNTFFRNIYDNESKISYENGEINITDDRYIMCISNEYIEVDPNKRYYEGVNIKSNNSEAKYYVGIVEYDSDYNTIGVINSSYVNGTLTYLEKDLNDGDTEIYVNSLKNFIVQNIHDNNSGLIFWNYKDSSGYEYPELTYSRNAWMGLFNNSSNFDLENNKIILNEPWKNGKFEKGTKLSQSNNGATYNYGVRCYENIGKEYKYYDNYLQGIKSYNEEYADSKFRAGTKYVRVLFLINYDSVPDVTTGIRDVIFAECE